MTEHSNDEPSQPEEEATQTPGAGHPVDDVEAPDEEPGRAKAEAAPALSDEEQEKGTTSHPAPEEDAGT